MYNQETINLLPARELLKEILPLLERLARKYEGKSVKEVKSLTKEENRMIYIEVTLEGGLCTLWKFKIREGEYPTVLDGILFYSEQIIF